MSRNLILSNTKHNQCICVLFLVMVVLGKFVILDAPLGRIESVLVTEVGPAADFSEMVPLEIRLESQRHESWLDAFISRRAFDLWTDIVCSRVSKAMLAVGGKSINCTSSEIATKDRIRDEFILHSLLSIFIIVAASEVLRSAKKAGIAVIAIIALAYTLTWPYAYGKLVKSTNFRYGEVVVKSPNASPDRQVARHAIIFDSGPNSSKILIKKESECPNIDESTETRTGAEVKLWEIPNSQIIAIKEIYWADVIAWKILNERSCPSAPTGPD
jgi:hypothetical protein